MEYTGLTDAAVIAANAIQASLDETCKDSYTVSIQNFGKCILIKSKDDSDSGRGWIRVTPRHSMTYIDVSSIELAPRDIRKGVFTHMMKTLLNCGLQGTLAISGIVTEDMTSWCIKNNWTPDSSIDGYTHTL